MQAGQFQSMMNPYEWLPSEGEIRISLRLEVGELFVDVVYQGEDDATEMCKTIKFVGVCSFYISSMPGVNLLAVNFEKVPFSGHLVEYTESEAALAWTEHLKYRQVRHFQIYFMSENKRLEVFAGAWQLIDDSLCAK